MNTHRRPANSLSVGQICLLGDPLLLEPLKSEHSKPSLLGHWGVTPGLNFIYVRLALVITKYDLDTICIDRVPEQGTWRPTASRRCVIR